MDSVEFHGFKESRREIRFLFRIYQQSRIFKVSAESVQDSIITRAVHILPDDMNNFNPAERKPACTEQCEISHIVSSRNWFSLFHLFPQFSPLTKLVQQITGVWYCMMTDNLNFSFIFRFFKWIYEHVLLSSFPRAWSIVNRITTHTLTHTPFSTI